VTAPRRRSRAAPRPAPFSLRLTDGERERLLRDAGNMPVASYIKSRVFADDAPTYSRRRKPPVLDAVLLAQVLACIGRSGIARSLHDLSAAANSGSLHLDIETRAALTRACHDIAIMRDLLMQSLGIKVGDTPPARQSTSQSFARAVVVGTSGR
jgi:hypothetical protein